VGEKEKWKVEGDEAGKGRGKKPAALACSSSCLDGIGMKCSD